MAPCGSVRRKCRPPNQTPSDNSGKASAVTTTVSRVLSQPEAVRGLDEMLELVRQPKDPMRSKGAFSLHELLRICTMTAIWLAFPNAKGPVGRKNAAMFSHLDASRFPGDIKGPLLTIYGAWFIGVVLLTANYVLMVLDS